MPKATIIFSDLAPTINIYYLVALGQEFRNCSDGWYWLAVFHIVTVKFLAGTQVI